MSIDYSLTEAELISFRRQVRVLEREAVRELETETGCCGVTVAQCHVLLELSDCALSLGGVASALDLDASTISRTVDGLVRAGLVERSEDPADRRSVRLELTGAGRDKVAFINDTCNLYYARLLGGMTAQEREHVLKGVGIMSERMRDFRPEDTCAPTAVAPVAAAQARP